MSDSVFINSALDYAITMYLKNKNRIYSYEYNSFLVVVVRMLVTIYDEEVIVNSYLKDDVKSFREEIGKYGFKNLDAMLIDMRYFYDWAKREKEGSLGMKSKEFISIQKHLVDMMILKMQHSGVDDGEKVAFENLLFTPKSPNPSLALYNLKVADNINAVLWYFEDEFFKLTNTEKTQVIKLGDVEAAKVVEVKQDSASRPLEKATDKISVDVTKDEIPSKLDKVAEVLAGKKNSGPLTSGSGFVDGLLLGSVMITLTMVAFVVSTLIFK